MAEGREVGVSCLLGVSFSSSSSAHSDGTSTHQIHGGRKREGRPALPACLDPKTKQNSGNTPLLRPSLPACCCCLPSLSPTCLLLTTDCLTAFITPPLSLSLCQSSPVRPGKGKWTRTRGRPQCKPPNCLYLYMYISPTQPTHTLPYHTLLHLI